MMKAALLLAPEKIKISTVADPQVGRNEVLIQPIQVGICGTDLSFYAGHRLAPYPFLLGHEMVGRVVAVGKEVAKIASGQRVIIEPNYPCGTCGLCRTGRGAICPNKKSMGVNVPGCFCQYATAPAEFVWPIADSISDTDAATIEPLAVSLHALLLSGARMGDTVAVLGCGVTGLLLIHAAVAQGVRVLAHDKIAGKLDMAHMLGAKVAGSDDVARLWLNENVTAVFECAGVSETVELALSAVPRGGRAILLGLSSSPACFLPIRLVREGIRIETSMIYDHPSDFARAIDLVAGGTLCPSRVVTNSFPFTAIEEALEVARTGQAGKVHIKIL